MLKFFKKAYFLVERRFSVAAKLSRRSVYMNHGRISIGARVTVGDGCVLYPILKEGAQRFDASITIDDDVYIGHHTQLHCIGKIKVGTGSVISDYVYISDASHGLSPEDGLIMKQALSTKGPVEIGQHCFIGYGASIMPGVKLGNHAVVSARAVVTKSVPPYSMVAGNPARIIKVFDHQSKLWVSLAK